MKLHGAPVSLLKKKTGKPHRFSFRFSFPRSSQDKEKEWKGLTISTRYMHTYFPAAIRGR